MSMRGKKKGEKILVTVEFEISNMRKFMDHVRKNCYNYRRQADRDNDILDAVSEVLTDTQNDVPGIQIMGTEAHFVEWFDADKFRDRAHPEYRSPRSR